MSPRDAQALQLLLESARSEESVRHTDLQRLLCIDKSNVTRLVQRLEEAGLVIQVTSPTDARSRLLRLTAKGERIGTSIEDSSHKLFERMLKKIPEARRTQVLECLSLLEDAARESIL
jgi:DNA-binding MarR family transcriptional regulator